MVLRNLNLTIDANKTIGIVGESGSGKTTIIDMILGLIFLNKGALLVDGQPLNDTTLKSWQKNFGYVSQHIFLLDASIAENVAFGIPKEDIDINKVWESLKLAHLDVLVQG